MSTLRIASLMALLALARPAAAQFTEARAGARVRVEAPGRVAGRLEGTVLSRTADSLTLGSPESAPLTIPISGITRMEISRGSSRAEGAMRGIQWGVGVGAIMGLLFLPAVHDCKTCKDNPSDVALMTQMISGSAIWGAGIGAIVGRERWERFDITPHVTVAGAGRVGLSFELGR